MKSPVFFRRMGSIATILIAMLLLVSCKSNDKIKIGFVIHSLANERWQTDIKYLTQRASENNAELLIRVANDDENKQLSDVRELLKEGIDVLIVVAVNQNTAAGMVREAHDHGVRVISYDRFIMNSHLDYYVSFEYEEVGRMMFDYATKLKPKGNYIFLWGEPSDANAIFIKNGQLKGLEAYPGRDSINVYHKVFINDWSSSHARYEMEKILEFGDKKIDAVIASNSSLALTAIEVLKEHNQQEGVVVTAQDIAKEAYPLILSGEQSMTVFKSMRDLAYAAMDVAIKLAKGKDITEATTTKNNGRKDVPAVMLQPVVVDSSNITAIVKSEGLFEIE